MAENAVLLGFVLLAVSLGLGLVAFFRRDRLRQNRSKLVLLAGNFLVLVFFGSLTLLIGELYFRFIHDSTEAFGLTKTTQRWFERHFEYNRFGIRDSSDDYGRKRRPGQRRITFLGDSFTVGHGIANVEDRFANRIRAAMSGAEVHVFAQPGMDTGAELNRLAKLVDGGYELDTVVLVYCLNDLADIVPEWQDIARRIYQREEPGFLVTNSYFVNSAYYRWFAARDPDVSSYYGFVRRNYDGPVWEHQARRLAQLQQLVTDRGGQLLVVTFPFLHELGPNYAYRAVHDKLGAFWQQRNVPHLDLLELFADASPGDVVVNRFDAHPNERAHEAAAGAIEEFLRRNAAGL